MKKKRSLFSIYMRMFMTGLAIMLIIEIGGLIFVDRSYLQENTQDVTVVHIPSNVESQAAQKEVKIESGAKDIKASYDGRYIAYTLDGELKVLNLIDGIQSTIEMDEDMELGFYKWVYDRDQLIIAEVKSTKSSHYAKLYNLNTKGLKSIGIPEEIRDTVYNTEAKIRLPSSSSYISDIDFSTSTVTTYLKITNKYDKSILWKFNLPDENKAYSISTKNIGRMQCLKFESELLYENNSSGKVCMAGEGAISVDGETKFRLLGFDNSDNVYLAKGDGDSTDTILYGSLLAENDDGENEITLKPKMKSVKLGEQVDIDDIYITLNGGIYKNDSAKKVFKNLVTGVETSYRGTFKSIYSKGFITVDNGVVLQNTLN